MFSASPRHGAENHDPILGRAVALGHSSLPRLPPSLTAPSCCSSLGEAWAQVKKSLADEAEVHLKFSAKVTLPSLQG